MGIQSLLFYSLVAWLPSIITSRGMDNSFAGTMALTFQLVGLPATLVLPIIADKFKNQRLIGTVKATIYLVGMLLLFYATTKAVLICSIILLSIGQGGSISLAIAFISLRTPHAQLAAELSGMAQSAGYLFAAIGPILLGVVYEITGSWDIPILILVASNILLFFFVLKAGRDRLVQP
ncbi:MAG: CP family cyanate transporter-like MFS transporter [Desulforhopalus sp.]|jgi:CP family cyanate transporter-like MFS transporter